MSEQNTIKIILNGSLDSGVTSFLDSISEIAASREHENDVAMDFGRFTIDEDNILYLFGTPKPRRYDFMWDILKDGILGFVVLIDSTESASFREAKKLIEHFLLYSPYPFIIAANKQDLEDAWSVEDLRIVLRIPPEIPIIPCVATDKKSVANVLLALCEEVLRDVDTEVEA